MQLDLTADEATVIADVLDSALGDLREQVYKTEVADYKDTLKRREAILTRVLGQLKARPAV
ncbi:MAG: hypothetical protein JO318_21960 [Chloroflexi bacterium]|nr:hypothetical protein [Chloroflexota bacterium]